MLAFGVSGDVCFPESSVGQEEPTDPELKWAQPAFRLLIHRLCIKTVSAGKRRGTLGSARRMNVKSDKTSLPLAGLCATEVLPNRLERSRCRTRPDSSFWPLPKYVVLAEK